MIGLLKVLYCTPFLIYSCYSDVKTRRVPNKLWVMMLGIGSIFVAYELLTLPSPRLLSHILRLGVSVCFIFILVYILFQFGAFGGADAKALIVLAVLIPSYPAIYSLPINPSPIDIFPFSVFGNAVLLAIVVPFGLFAYNITHLSWGEIRENPLFLFVGYKYRISGLKDRHVKLMQEHLRVGREVLVRFRRGGIEVDDNVIAGLNELEALGLISNKVWVTPGLPFMIPITAGFYVAVVYGDLIFLITRYLMGF